MNHHTTKAFWDRFRALPPEIQAVARKNFQLLERDPAHPSLQFKKVGRFWSARVGRSFSALAVVRDNDCVWFWIVIVHCQVPCDAVMEGVRHIFRSTSSRNRGICGRKMSQTPTRERLLWIGPHDEYERLIKG